MCMVQVRKQMLEVRDGITAAARRQALCLTTFSNKILVTTEGAIRPLCGKISPIPR